MMVAKKGPGPIKGPVNMKLLSKTEKEELRAEARKSVLEELTQEARDAYFKQALLDVRRENAPAAQIVDVMMDMAPFLPHIAIDGVQYFHGYTYPVERTRAVVLYEQMQRSWLHQDEIDGRSRFNPYRRAQNVTIGPRHMGQPTAGANGVVVMAEDAEV
jgi:hypothetical protein